MTLSGWFAICCWAILAAVILGAAAALAWRDRRQRLQESVPERLDFRDWLDDWDYAEPFDPDWCVHPGATLKEWMDERRLTVYDVAGLCRLSGGYVVGVLDGRARITDQAARKLAVGTGISAAFWESRERQFREALAAGKAWA